MFHGLKNLGRLGSGNKITLSKYAKSYQSDVCPEY